MKNDFALFGKKYSSDSKKISSQKRLIYQAPNGAEIKKVETNGKDKIFLLLRGVKTAALSNFITIDHEGQVLWKAKEQPSEYDDELVDFEYKIKNLMVWSWNFVYKFDEKTGKLLHKEINK